MGQDKRERARQAEQEAGSMGRLMQAELSWLASERRCWDEVSDAWRANPAASVFEDVSRWTARSYVRSLALCVADLNDPARPLLRSLVTRARKGGSKRLEALEDGARADAKALERLSRRLRSLADDVLVFSDEEPIARSDVFKEVDAVLDELFVLANRYLGALEIEPVRRPSRRFYPNGIMRRPWLGPSWRPCLFPARADLERAGEFWPVLDFLSQHDHAAIVGNMSRIIDLLEDRSVWLRPSPIRSVLDELGLPSTDPCLQLVRDQLFAFGMDWRPDPPPIPPPVD